MKLLVLGCGSIGRRHVLSARQLGADVHVMDVDPALAKSVASETGATQHHDVLSSALAHKPDAVVVATPNDQHVKQAMKALESGAHVLIEKPVSHNLDGLDSLSNLAKSQKRSVFVICNMRYHKAVEALWNNREALGKVRYARAHYGNYLPNMRPGADYRELYCSRMESGGGVIFDAIHELDYLMWLFGSVSAVGANKARLSDLDIDVEDFANIVLEHSNGIRSVITIDYLRPWKRRGCEIICQDGMLIWNSEGKQPERCEVRMYQVAKANWEVIFTSDDLDPEQPYIDMMADFFSAVEGHQSRLQTLEEARDRLEVALKAHGSARAETGHETK